VKVFGLFLLLFIASASAQSSNSAYRLVVTVQGSSIDCGTAAEEMAGCAPHMNLSVIIEGRHLELSGSKIAKHGILALGEYKAKLVTDKHEKPYFSEQVYELQYPDGETEKYTVTGEMK
jgi:hypothetical protein